MLFDKVTTKLKISQFDSQNKREYKTHSIFIKVQFPGNSFYIYQCSGKSALRKNCRTRKIVQDLQWHWPWLPFTCFNCNFRRLSRWFWVINYIQIFDGQLVMKYRKDRFKVEREWVLILMLGSLLDFSSWGFYFRFILPVCLSDDSGIKNPAKQFINDLNKVFPEKKSFLGIDLEKLRLLSNKNSPKNPSWVHPRVQNVSFRKFSKRS